MDGPDTESASADRLVALAWARRSLTMLRSIEPADDEAGLICLGDAIGDARVVALGEGDHFCAEPMRFRNRLFQYLVEEKGFTAIALESGIVESRAVHEYVRGAGGDLEAAVRRGIAWTFDRLPQNVELVRWLREYNVARDPSRKINFYGFDVPGSPSNPAARRGVDTAIMEVVEYLDRVDPRCASMFRSKLRQLQPDLRFDIYNSPKGAGYHRLSTAERDSLTALVADLMTMLERREAAYVASSSAGEYEWALRAAIGARQVDAWLREVPADWQADAQQLRFIDVASDVRDRAQADNLEWILGREGDRGRVLVYGHNNHLSMAPVTWTWRPTGTSHEKSTLTAATYVHEVAGTYLKRRVGSQLVTIGHLFAGGTIGCATFEQQLPASPADSLDGLARDTGAALFFLDLRKAPADAARWFGHEQRFGPGFELTRHYNVGLSVVPGTAFDLVIYTDLVSPACEFRK